MWEAARRNALPSIVRFVGEAAAEVFDHSAGDRESQAGAFLTTVSPARERFEQLPDEILGHPLTVVLHRDQRSRRRRWAVSDTEPPP